jgi:hypothetical protein
MTRPQYDPETEFWLEVRSLLCRMLALLEKTKLKSVIRLPTNIVRDHMRSEGWEPERSTDIDP